MINRQGAYMSTTSDTVSWLLIIGILALFYILSIVLELSSREMFMFGNYEISKLNNVINGLAFMAFISLCYTYLKYV